MLLQSKVLVDHGFLHAFPTRESGDAELLRHLSAERVVQAKQVHGALAVEATDAAGEAEVAADAILGRRPLPLSSAPSPSAVAVGVRVADCVPLLLGDAESGDVAAVHAGWRGVVAGVVPTAALALSARAAANGTLYAAIGPCIGACCFEVGRDVKDAIARSAPSGAAGVVVWEARDKAYVNLRAAVRAQLRALGVRDASIDDVAGCTKHEPDRFHSYRRDGAASGRMLAAIAARR